MKLSTSFAVLATLMATHAELDYSPLGTNSLEVYDYKYTTKVDDNDQYTLTVYFQHDPTFPIGAGETCKPFEIADDGMGYLDKRWYYEGFDPKTTAATGFDHVSIDYNACGHPPEGYSQAHYDLHYYRISPEQRLGLTCDQLSTAPICDFNNNTQTTSTGEAFFHVARSTETGHLKNMPPGYEVDLVAAVPYMGTHMLDPNETPATRQDWVHPVMVYCTWNATVIGFEPMFPFHFNHGDKDTFYERQVNDMVEQDDMTLPTYYSVAYEAATGITTVILQGTSATPHVTFGEPVEYSAVQKEKDEDEDEEDDNKATPSGASTGSFPSRTGAGLVVASLAASGLWLV